MNKKTKKELIEIIENNEKTIENVTSYSNSLGSQLNSSRIELDNLYSKNSKLKHELDYIKIDNFTTRIADLKTSILLIQSSVSGLTHREKRKFVEINVKVLEEQISKLVEENRINSSLPF